MSSSVELLSKFDAAGPCNPISCASDHVDFGLDLMATCCGSGTVLFSCAGLSLRGNPEACNQADCPRYDEITMVPDLITFGGQSGWSTTSVMGNVMGDRIVNRFSLHDLLILPMNRKPKSSFGATCVDHRGMVSSDAIDEIPWATPTESG